MKRVTTLLLCLCAVFSLAACGQEDAYVPTGDGLTWDEDYTGPVYTRPEDPQTEDLSLIYYPDKTLNPLACTDFTNQALFSLLFQGLFSVDRGYRVEPVLCKNYRVSEDMLTHTFYIEPQATFSNGTPVTARDVVASLNAASQTDRYSGRFFHIREITLGEDGGVVISTKIPYENLPVLLDIPIIKQVQVDADQPIGSGPYILGSSMGSMQLVKNPNWWCKTELPVKQEVITLLTAESHTQIRDEFQFGQLDLVCADPGSDRYADYRCDYELWDCENGIFVYVGCNMISPVFSDQLVRAALTHAIDRDMLAEAYYRGFARGASLPASPLSPYYNSNFAARYGYAPDKFTKAVREAGFEGQTVTLLVNSDDSLRVRVARDIAEQLRQCGLDVVMKEEGGSDYISSLRNRYYDLYVGQTMLSANMDLSAFFHENGALSYGSVNDETAYTLCQQALENHGNYFTLYQTVMDQGLLCPVLFRSYAIYATRGLVTDLTPARDSIFYYSLGKSMENALLTE